MKTLCILLFTIATFSPQLIIQDQEVKATFIEVDDNVYYFKDGNDSVIAFEGFEEDASKKYVFTDKSNVGKTFLITYTTTTESDDLDESYDILTIKDLELVTKK